MAKKMIGAIILLRPKKYWTLVVSVKSMRPGGFRGGGGGGEGGGDTLV